MSENDYTLNRLAHLKRTGSYPGRDPGMAAGSRAQYLEQVHSILEHKSARAEVPLSPFKRVKEWADKRLYSILRRRCLVGQNAYQVILLITVIPFACTGVALAAAQTSQPVELLYPLKLISEDIKLRLVADPQDKFDLLMSLSARRVEEILTLRTSSRLIPEQVAARLEGEIQHLFLMAATGDDQTMLHSLEKMRERLSQYEQHLAIAQEGEVGLSDPVYERLSAMLRIMSVLTESGLADPGTFRQRLRQNLPNSGAGTPPETSPTPVGRHHLGTANPTPECTTSEPALSSTSDTLELTKLKGTEEYDQGQISGSNGTCDACSPGSYPEHDEKPHTSMPAGGSENGQSKERGGKEP